MRGIIYLLLIIFLFPSIVFGQTNNKIEIGYVENGVAVITYEQSKLLRTFEIQYGDTLQASTLECIAVSEDNYYLTAKLQNQNTNLITAQPLIKEGLKLFVAADNGGRVAHACEGAPCSMCAFLIANGDIIGCICREKDGRCNHRIIYLPGAYFDILNNL
ncbi:MAG: hypothetical protein ACPLGZ_01575 [Candidatus Pelagibacter ubique]